MAEIELTDEQRQALHAESGKPLAFVDPASQRRYVLVPEEQFEDLLQAQERPPAKAPAEPHAAILPQMLKSQQAFWRDLPELPKLKSAKKRFVAYYGNQRIGFGRTQTELYQECFRRGLKRGEFYVGFLEETEEPPWGSSPLEESLYEFTDLAAPSSATPPPA